jgi:hypothetical protein
MSGLTPYPVAEPTEDAQKKIALVQDGLMSLSVVVAWFGIAALIGALIWWQVTPLAEFTRTADNAGMDEEQLAKQFSTDGWFFVIAAVGGLVSGLVLVLLRRRNPILMVLLVALGGAFATFVMLEFGLMLGPSDPTKVLPTTPVGGKVPLQLKPTAHGVWFVWSIAALAGGIVALWIAEAREDSRRQYAAAQGYDPGQQVSANHR